MKRRPTRSIRPASKAKGASPINARQRQLADEEARVKKQMEDLEREIIEAPSRRQEALKTQRNEILRSYEQRRGTDFFSRIPDKRFTLRAETAAIPVRRRRKGEQKAAQIQFYALVVVLIFWQLFSRSGFSFSQMSESDSKFDVRHVAHLARIELSDAETDKFQSQISEVLAHVAQLQSVDVTGVEPTAHTYPIFNVFRDDRPRDWFTPEEALKNAPRQANQLFVVPKVLE